MKSTTSRSRLVRYSLEKEFTELIRINPLMVLYLTVNQIDSCHDYVCGPLT